MHESSTDSKTRSKKTMWEATPTEYYSGIPIFARKGLHEHVFGVLCKKGFLIKGAKAVDLATGGGAFAQRLVDVGCEVLAVDADPENFVISNNQVKFMQADLNDEFAEQLGTAAWDIVVAMEIVEHLENQRAFFRNCVQLLKPGGILMITTPNIESSVSIAQFVLTGTFANFGEGQYQNIGHITPTYAWQMEKMMAETGSKVIELFTFSPNRIQFMSWPRLAIASMLIRWLRVGEIRREGAIVGIIAKRL